MKQKKIPMRMCIGCRQMKPKRELVRLVRDADGNVFVDATGRAAGRGAYICRDAACLERAVKIRAIEHAFSQGLDEAALLKLREEFSRDEGTKEA